MTKEISYDDLMHFMDDTGTRLAYSNPFNSRALAIAEILCGLQHVPEKEFGAVCEQIQALIKKSQSIKK